MDMNKICLRITDSDQVILQSLKKYMADRGYVAEKMRPDEYLHCYDQCKNIFYSDVAQRTTRIIDYINDADENDDYAKAFKFALSRHMRDKAFLDILSQQLKRENNRYSDALVGSFLCEAIREYQEEMTKLDEADADAAKANKKKDDKATAPLKSHVDPEIVEMMLAFGRYLLSDYRSFVQGKFIKLTDTECLVVSAIIAMGNENVAYALLESDLPITADILDCPMIKNDQLPKIYAGILQLKKSDWVKLSVNQTKFLESLTKWIYTRLNCLEMNLCLQLLVAAYKSSAPAEIVKTCLIQPKDCGSQYPNLKQVAISLKIN